MDEDYVNIALEKGKSILDFHFYSFFDGTAHEIANYVFDDIEGILEYRQPMTADDDGNLVYLGEGRLAFTTLKRPRGWYLDTNQCDIFKFFSLMDATIAHQNIEQLPSIVRTSDHPLFTHFVGLKVKAEPLDSPDSANDVEYLVFPNPKYANMRLYDYNFCRDRESAVSLLGDQNEAGVEGLAVAFSNFGFKAVTTPENECVFEMDSKFYPFSYDAFEVKQEGDNG